MIVIGLIILVLLLIAGYLIYYQMYQQDPLNLLKYLDFLKKEDGFADDAYCLWSEWDPKVTCGTGSLKASRTLKEVSKDIKGAFLCSKGKNEATTKDFRRPECGKKWSLCTSNDDCQSGICKHTGHQMQCVEEDYLTGKCKSSVKVICNANNYIQYKSADGDGRTANCKPSDFSHSWDTSVLKTKYLDDKDPKQNYMCPANSECRVNLHCKSEVCENGKCK